MDLTHEFTVPASKPETWAALNDLESVAGCFPGAAVDSVDGDTFTGTCKVKLGPIALVYKGSGRFTEKDEAAGVMKIEAKGKDKRGNGTAGADVVATITEASAGETHVRVVTDLNITGKPAQFGRGVIQDISDKLLGQFVDCLQGKVGGEPEAQEDNGAATSGTEQGAAPSSPARGSSDATTTPAGSAAASVSSTTNTGGRHAAEGPASSVGAGSSAAPADGDDALDLGATVVPILLKTYGKQLAAGLGVLALLVWILRRR